MNNIKFELDSNGVQELLKSPEMQAILDSYAQETANRAGTGYAAETHIGKKRAYANIYAETYKARKDNWDNNTLLKSLK